MKTVIPACLPPSVPVAGSDAVFPIHRIYCVGRNYADHAREMGHDPTREPPFFFSKPADAVVSAAGADGEVAVRYPLATSNLHHEVEMVVALQGGGENLEAGAALATVYGYAVGLDLTRRDIQGRAKEKGHPWDMGKGFDQSAPISAIVPAAVCGHPSAGAVLLKVNGEQRQSGDLSQMSWKVAEVIAELSRYVKLAAGDLIFTGTPAGVGPTVRGDLLEANVAGVAELKVRMV
jgi:fumarylpyruvate hydrolase